MLNKSNLQSEEEIKRVQNIKSINIKTRKVDVSLCYSSKCIHNISALLKALINDLSRFIKVEKLSMERELFMEKKRKMAGITSLLRSDIQKSMILF